MNGLAELPGIERWGLYLRIAWIPEDGHAIHFRRRISNTQSVFYVSFLDGGFKI